MKIEDYTQEHEARIIQYFSTPKRPCSPEDARDFWVETTPFAAAFEYGWISTPTNLKVPQN